MPNHVATSIIVFGRGLSIDETGLCLNRASMLRVRAAVNYIERHPSVFSSRRARVVFSGGWAGAAEGLAPPTNEFREAALMLKLAHTLKVDGENFSFYAEPYLEIESDSTLDSVLRVEENGYFGGALFTAEDPLGIVAHEGHLARIDYLVRRIFRLPKDAILCIAAAGEDNLSGGFSENIMLILTRLAFIGAREHASFRRRHRILLVGRNMLRLRQSSLSRH